VKFGVYVPNFGPYGDARTLAALAREAEDAGWDGFFIWDHIAGEWWPERMVDAWVALAAIALNTERVRIGALVTPLPRRRPWKVARESVSIDQLSNGRLIFGAGTGDGRSEWEDLGEEADARTRGVMLDEGLEALTGLWRGEPFSYDGQYYHIRQAHFLPKPAQSPRIPIWVAGHWPHKAPFRRAARWDGVFPGTWDLPPEKTRELIAYIKQHRQSDAPFDVAHGGMTWGDPARDAAIVAPHAAAGVTWWLENVSPSAFDCSWKGEWPLDRMRARILAGPPRL
jgi:alkanesulfonate monooxygenase SsuD/methylene tetrahydromethanopterin reductase-like flavin-dependent oxidoreductase (luciferase family)